MNSIKKIIISVAILGTFSTSVFARPETDTSTICYGVNAQGKQTYKKPCIVTSTGGAGESITIFDISGKKYEMFESNYHNTLNGISFKSYSRDAFFQKTSDPDAPYYCHQSKKAHFCFKVAG